MTSPIPISDRKESNSTMDVLQEDEEELPDDFHPGHRYHGPPPRSSSDSVSAALQFRRHSYASFLVTQASKKR